MRFLLISLILLIFPEVSADSFTFDMGSTQGSMMGRIIQVFLAITAMSLAPSIIMMVTSFTRFIIVFSFLRTALGTQQSPPNMVIIGLALFLSAYVMGPTFEKAYEEGVAPLIAEKITEEEAFSKISDPFQTFMLKNTRKKDLKLFADMSKLDTDSIEKLPLRVVIPSFINIELRRAFEIGFLVFIPFLVIDMVISSVLMTMGMMMLPPVMISTPFKIIFFVLVDGWHLICGSLVNSFVGAT